jgi:phage FluMu gp28-like protein
VAHIQDRTLTTPQDADVLADLRSLRKSAGVVKVPAGAFTTGADGKSRHGDSAIAAALATYAVDVVDAGPIEFQTAPSSPRGMDGAADRGHRDDDIRIPEPQAW